MRARQVIYWLDYDFINSTNNRIRDAFPACATVLETGPEPIDGSPADFDGTYYSWDVPNSDGGAPFRERGSVRGLGENDGCFDTAGRIVRGRVPVDRVTERRSPLFSRQEFARTGG